MSFQEFTGQRRAVQVLQNALKRNSLAHAYIFSGPVGTGRKRMAVTLAQAVYCLQQDGEACGECLECRKVENDNHPDFYWIEPDGATIKIDQIRELKRKFGYRATHASTKIYVLNNAERMTVQAANSLLKFLEEPVAKVVAILIAENGQALLPTIRSRAQWIPFLPMSPLRMAEILINEGYPHDLVRSAVHLSAGLEAARELIQLNWFAETRNIVIQLAKASQDDPVSALSMIQHQVMKGEAAAHLSEMLDLWILWYKDMINVTLGRTDQVVYKDQLGWLEKHRFSCSIQGWIEIIEKIMEFKRRLRYNVNSQLGLEGLAVSIKGFTS